MSAEDRKPGKPGTATVRLVGTADDLHDGQPTTHEPAAHETTIHETTAHEHEHEHAHERAPLASGSFPHEKLDAYHVAVAMAALANRLAEQIPRGHRNIADHMLRAASNAVLLLAEGANRRGAGQKRQRFVESRGECGEVAAAADLLLAYGIGSRPDAEQLRRLTARVSAMLTRLITRLDE